ncbi:MAG TPA: DUF47 family protein [Candidatus Kapabacteria bacterium]|nr:DUF47 family protein [Candidatus Kapabacteria bacterium]
MFKGLLPKEYSFYEYFESHSSLCKEAAAELVELTKNFSKLDESSKKIKNLEKRMDEITLKCTEDLLQTFITPIERTDIHQLIEKLDDIADGINATVSRIKLYQIESLKPEAVILSELIYESVCVVNDLVYLIRDMKNADKIKAKCAAIRKIEKESDEVYKSAIVKLFESKDVIDIIKWKEIYDRFEKVVDRTQQVGGIVESIVITAA